MSRAPLHPLQAIVSLGCVLVPAPSKPKSEQKEPSDSTCHPAQRLLQCEVARLLGGVAGFREVVTVRNPLQKCSWCHKFAQPGVLWNPPTCCSNRVLIQSRTLLTQFCTGLVRTLSMRCAVTCFCPSFLLYTSI